METYLTLSTERYEQLLRAEHDANHLKALIADRNDNYHGITRDDLNLLYTMFIGKKEEE